MKKKKIVKRFVEPFKQLFRTRNVIVISEQAVEHYPLSGKLQLLALSAVLGFFCWISYSTGSYMAAQSVMKEKDKKIISTSLENKKIGEEYTLLKRDLIKLKDKSGEELSEYSEFILEQYMEDASGNGLSFKLDDPDSILLHQDIVSASGDSKLLERISFLENMIEELKNHNASVVAAVRSQTDSKIEEFEEIIELSGLQLKAIRNRASREIKERKEAMLEGSEEDTGLFGWFRNQGGPYEPEETNPFSSLDADLSEDIQGMMILYEIINALPVSEPMHNAKQSSGFGRRVDPFTKRWAMHSGLDFVGAVGTHIKAAGDGTVTHAGKKGAYGNLVEIDHGFGITTRYGHLSKVSVEEDQKVTSGQTVGIQGNTGRSTGAHLHFEVRYNNRPLNPKRMLEVKDYVLKK